MPAKETPVDIGQPLRLYLWGLGCVLLGAWLMSQTGSMWPLALGGAASIMLTVPLVRHFLPWLRARR